MLVKPRGTSGRPAGRSGRQGVIMRFGRAAAVAVVAAVATGGCLLAGNSSGSAATPPPPTPISLGLTGMSSSACPLPLNGSMAIKPGTTVQFKPEAVLGMLETL